MATKTVLETLEAARKLITPRKNWTRGVIARDAAGLRIDPVRPEAVCWCSYGAIDASSRNQRIKGRSLVALYKAAGTCLIGEWNDAHTHAEVLAAFDAAIAKEKEAQHA